MKRILFLMLLAMSITIQPIYGDTSEKKYEDLVSLAYDPIVYVTDMYFIEASSGNEGETRYSLYTLEGDIILEAYEDIRLVSDYIVAKKEDYYDLYTMDMTMILSAEAMYRAIAITSPNQCVVNQRGLLGDDGLWYGNQYLVDLPSGRVVENLGQGGEQTDLMASFLVENRAEEVYSQEAFTVYTKLSHQLVLDFSDKTLEGYNSLYFDAGARYIYGYASDEETSHHYLYSGTGRLIDASMTGYYRVMYNGLYMVYTANDYSQSSLLTTQGDLILEAGVYDTYDFNYSHSDTKTLTYEEVSTNPWYVVVSKGGQYGVIEVLPYEQEPSFWASEEVDQAYKMGIVPEGMDTFYKDQCSRQQFCRLLVNAMEQVTEESIESIADHRESVIFEDTKDPYVLAAAALGIVGGVGDGRFAPDAYMTRQEAAVMLSRAADFLSIPSDAEPLVFRDSDLIASWALEGVNRVTSVETLGGETRLMQGTWQDHFAPQAYYTVEQSILTCLRLAGAKQ